jgi:hypothetical protein
MHLRGFSECKAGNLCIERGWLWLHESGTYVKFHRQRCDDVCLRNYPQTSKPHCVDSPLEGDWIKHIFVEMVIT